MDTAEPGWWRRHAWTLVLISTAFGIGILILFIGALIGTLGSAIGLRRFLDT